MPENAVAPLAQAAIHLRREFSLTLRRLARNWIKMPWRGVMSSTESHARKGVYSSCCEEGTMPLLRGWLPSRAVGVLFALLGVTHMHV